MKYAIATVAAALLCSAASANPLILVRAAPPVVVAADPCVGYMPSFAGGYSYGYGYSNAYFAGGYGGALIAVGDRRVSFFGGFPFVVHGGRRFRVFLR